MYAVAGRAIWDLSQRNRVSGCFTGQSCTVSKGISMLASTTGQKHKPENSYHKPCNGPCNCIGLCALDP